MSLAMFRKEASTRTMHSCELVVKFVLQRGGDFSILLALSFRPRDTCSTESIIQIRLHVARRHGRHIAIFDNLDRGALIANHKVYRAFPLRRMNAVPRVEAFGLRTALTDPTVHDECDFRPRIGILDVGLREDHMAVENCIGGLWLAGGVRLEREDLELIRALENPDCRIGQRATTAPRQNDKRPQRQ